MSTESEFGQGLTYCLGLFLAHQEKLVRIKELNIRSKSNVLNAQMWFYASTDHLCELVIPYRFPFVLKDRIQSFVKKCFEWRSTSANFEDVYWALDEAKELLRLIDEHWGIETKKATWK